MRFLIIRKRTLLIGGLIGLALILAVVSVIGTGSAAVFNGKTTRQLPVYNVGTEEKKVAISFDAAWGSDRTQSILDTLKEHDAKATFFLVGFWTRKYPDLVKKIDEAGLEIGTHSNTHPHMPKLSETQMDLELSASKSAITEITGKEVKLFRAPFGEYSDKMMNVAKKSGLTTIQWDVDSLDWQDKTSKEMSERVLSRVKPGSIVLFHNDGKYTPEALPAILMGLKNKGYQVVAIGDLLLQGNYYIDHAGTMRST